VGEAAGSACLAVAHLQMRTHLGFHEHLVLNFVQAETGLQGQPVSRLVSLVVVLVWVRLVNLALENCRLERGLQLGKVQIRLSLFI